MLSARNTILAVIAVFGLSLIVGTLMLLGPPGRNGPDSYGTRGHGYRALVELLTAFDVPVERRIAPPTGDLPTNCVQVLWCPDPQLVGNEPLYLTRLLTWVERGGRIVVSPVPREQSLTTTLFQAHLESHGDVWSALELKDAELEEVLLDDSANGTTTPKEQMRRIASESRQARRERIQRGIQRALEDSFRTTAEESRFTSLPATATGSLDFLSYRVRHLQVPAGQFSQLKVGDDSKSTGKLTCHGPKGETWTLAAVFPRGLGEIIVISEQSLLTNVSLSHADNSILAFDLLSQSGRTVVFDEFYHGLSVRGNPMWLLTQSGYATVAAALLGVLLVEIWRRSQMIGPGLELAIATRRTIAEYINAMAQFLSRGKDSRMFLLDEVRVGVLRTLAQRVGLAARVDHPEQIANAMARRSPRDADEFRSSIQQLDIALKRDRLCSESEALRAIQRICRCL